MTREKKMAERVKPEILGGFRDFLPQEAAVRQEMLAKIRRVYERFGFLPLETPALERSAVLGTSEPDFAMEVYRFKAGDLDVTLRFDLTVPLSRVVAANPDLPKPFKRYQLGNVWRREKPQAGRFREFAQFDADIVGSSSMTADAEIITLIFEVMRALGVNDILIRFNNRKLMNGLPAFAGFDPQMIKQVLRILDKLDKISWDDAVKELQRQPDNQFDDTAPQLSDEAVAKVRQFLDLQGDKDTLLEQLDVLMKDSPIALEGIRELREICRYLRAYQIPETYWKIDLSVSRGLDYYTGPVFETTLLSLPSYGSVMSGGRFDGLVAKFTGQEVPAVGASIGVDRLFAALKELGRLPNYRTRTQLLIANWDDEYVAERVALAGYLRRSGYDTEMFFDGRVPLNKQIAYALKRGIPYMILFGRDEIERGSVTVKMLDEKDQRTVRREDLFAFLDAFVAPNSRIP